MLVLILTQFSFKRKRKVEEVNVKNLAHPPYTRALVVAIEYNCVITL